MNHLIAGLAATLKPEQLDTIQLTPIGIAGLGGLGSNVACHLVRSGFSRLILADFDRVEVSNLNRQVYFPDQLGLLKTEALAENLLRIQPGLNPRIVANSRDLDQCVGDFRSVSGVGRMF